MAETVATTTSVDQYGGGVWGNIGSAINGTLDAFSQAFLAKELAKIEASTAGVVAQANAQAAIANATAEQAAANAAAQAQNHQASATGGFVVPGWAKWVGVGALVVVGGYAFLKG